MNENWSDFEKYVFEKLSELSAEISSLKGQAVAWGAIAGIIGVILSEVIAKAIVH